MTTAPLPNTIPSSAIERIQTFHQEGRVADAEAIEALVQVIDAQQPAYLTLHEAAKRLYITPERVLRRIENGWIEGAVVNGRPVVIAASLAKYHRLFETFDALDQDRTPPTADEINAALATARKDWTWIGRDRL